MKNITLILMILCMFTACSSDPEDDNSNSNSAYGAASPKGLYLVSNHEPIITYELNDDGLVKQMNAEWLVFTYTYFPTFIKVVSSGGSVDEEYTFTLENGRVIKVEKSGLILYEYEYDSKFRLAKITEYRQGNKSSEQILEWNADDLVKFIPYSNYWLEFYPSDTSTSVPHEGRCNPLFYALCNQHVFYYYSCAAPLLQFFGKQPRHLLYRMLYEMKNEPVYNSKIQDYVDEDVMIGEEFNYEIKNGRMTEIMCKKISLSKEGKPVLLRHNKQYLIGSYLKFQVQW